MKAFLKNYRQSPRKVRLVAGAFQGENVNEAIGAFNFLVQSGGEAFKKVFMLSGGYAKNMEDEGVYVL